MTESSQPDGTRLRLARQARGLSQQQLAGVAGVTRQAVSAVESGHSDPSLRVALGLARALGMTVEELFGPGEPGDPVLARPVAPVSAPGSRVALATVGDTFVALPLDADLAARLGFGAAGGLTVRGGSQGAQEAQGVHGASGGQGPRSRCGRSGRRGPPWWWPAATRRCRCSRRRSRCSTRRWRSPGGRAAVPRPCAWPRLAWCTRPACTASARERGDDTSGIPGGAEVVGFASWREGLVVRPGAGVRGLDDVARQGLRLVNREPGAQARTLLDRERLRLGLEPSQLPGYDSLAAGHLQVAAAIVGGLADAGVSSEPAALAYGLDFIPLAEEHFDLLLPAKHAASREVQGLLKVLTSPWLLAQLASLPGYDAARCGERPS